MWLRDSTAQVKPYLALAGKDETLRQMILGLVERQMAFILMDPYANAFNQAANGHGHQTDHTQMGPLDLGAKMRWIPSATPSISLSTLESDRNQSF